MVSFISIFDCVFLKMVDGSGVLTERVEWWYKMTELTFNNISEPNQVPFIDINALLVAKLQIKWTAAFFQEGNSLNHWKTQIFERVFIITKTCSPLKICIFKKRHELTESSPCVGCCGASFKKDVPWKHDHSRFTLVSCLNAQRPADNWTESKPQDSLTSLYIQYESLAGSLGNLWCVPPTNSTSHTVHKTFEVHLVSMNIFQPLNIFTCQLWDLCFFFVSLS